jgi:hypothetical protein
MFRNLARNGFDEITLNDIQQLVSEDEAGLVIIVSQNLLIK